MTDVILGYNKDGEPIHPAKKGCIYTAAFILCSECGESIRSYGGPMYGAMCVKCHDKAEGK